MEIKKTNSKTRVKTTHAYKASGREGSLPVEIYFNAIDKTEIEDWETIKEECLIYKAAKDAFHDAFTDSELAVNILKVNPNNHRYLKPPKDTNEKYFKYTYLAIFDVIDHIRDVLVAAHRIKNDYKNIFTRWRIRRKLSQRIKNYSNFGLKTYETHGRRLYDLYIKMTDFRDEVVENNLKLVINIANNFKHNPSPAMGFADLIQEGNVGLLKTVDSYNVDTNIRFSSYSVGLYDSRKRSYVMVISLVRRGRN
jgi:hypothetical protein